VGPFVKGDVLVVSYPFADFSERKRRPALVVAVSSPNALVLAQITTRPARDAFAVPLVAADFHSGGIRKNSRIRTNILFTMDTGLILYRTGHITVAKMQEVTDRIVLFFTS
jgi:mRNA interferase MazF